MDKQQKAEYDKKYRERKKEEIRLKKKLYCESESGRSMQKRQRQKNKESGYHNEYCRKPEQREKERKRRHIREGKTDLKTCILCNNKKQKIEFNSFSVFPDKLNYQCKECEYNQQLELGLTTRNILQYIRSNLIKTKSNLKVSDVAKYPYLIEVNKYLISLKKLTK